VPGPLKLEISAAGEAEAGSDVQLLGLHLSSPAERPSPSPYNVRIEGWALAASGPPDRFDVVASVPLAGGGELRRTLTSVGATVPHLGVAERFPDVPGSGTCGFYVGSSLLGLPAEFELHIEAHFGSRAARIGTVRGQRRELPADGAPGVSPLLIKTMGRAGSTWLTRLLGDHPEVVVFRPFDFEPRITTYWLDILRTLSNPQTYSQSVDPDVRGEKPWWVGGRRGWGPVDIPEEEVLEWLETESVEDLARFCRGRIAGFYKRAAAAAGKTGVRRFAERVQDWPEMALGAELFAHSREVFLVRDFRDVLVSRLAFNRKTGQMRFGREEAASDEEYVDVQMRTQVATLLDASRTRQDHALLVRYEDLMHNPHETLARLFGYADVADDDVTVEQVMRRASELSAVTRERHMTAGGGRESVGRWRSELSPALARAANEAFGDALEVFGYER
jgi:hypothetical protein